MVEVDSFLIFGSENRRAFWTGLYDDVSQLKYKFVINYDELDSVLPEIKPKVCFVYDYALNDYKTSFRDSLNNGCYAWFLISTDKSLSTKLMLEFDGISFILEESFISIDTVSILLTNGSYLKKLSFEKAQLKKTNIENTHFRENLLSNVSHELRTPLNGILGFATLLIEDSLSADQRDSVQVIIDSSNKLIKVVDNLLDHTDISTSNITLVNTECDLVDLLFISFESCLKTLEDKSLQLVFDVKQAHLWIEADSNKLRTVFEHLINNAIKFTGTGSVVVRMNEAVNDLVSIDVIDTGCGISKETFPNLFKAFEQGDGSITRRHGGTGLGLFIAEKYIQSMGGEINVTNNIDQGCTFSIVLPIMESTYRSEDRPEHPCKSILVASDDQVMTDMYSQYDSIHNYSYHNDLSVQDKDFVLVDFPLRSPLNEETMTLIQDAKRKQIPCIGLIEFNNSDQRTLCDEYGIQTIYAKPFHPHNVEMSMKRLSSNLKPVTNLASEVLNILILEDERVSQVLFSRCLESKGHKVSLFDNSLQALSSFTQTKYDLMIVDLQIPEMDGFQFTEEIRKIDTKVPILATSAATLEDTHSICIAAGMNDFLPKPFSKLDLYGMIFNHTGVGSTDNYSKYRILHIDDEEHILDIVSYALEELLPGINVKKSNNAIEACTLLGSFQPHVVITDMNMPQMDGLAFVRYMKCDPLYKDTFVYVLTGLSESNPSVRQINKLGIEKILHKPFKAKNLVEHLKKTFDIIQ